MSATDVERAWAAGFFDGEGYVGYHQRERDGSRSISCSITQASSLDGPPTVLERFKSIVGLGNIYRKQLSEPHRTRYVWSVQSLSDVETVHQLLFPYLDIVKREQFTQAISEFKKRSTYQELGLCRKRLHKKAEGEKQCKECQTAWQLD